MQHRIRKSFPLEVGLETGEEQERLADLVGRQVERETSGTVVAQVVLVEIYRRTAGTVIEKNIGVEGRDQSRGAP